jgi:hypothetical protein
MPVFTTVDNYSDVIDSRDVIGRIEELMEIDEPADADVEELTALLTLATEGEATTNEWADGATLVRESYWAEYCEELCDELGGMENIPDYIRRNIDWEAVGDALKVDYASVDFDGTEYFVRSC